MRVSGQLCALAAPTPGMSPWDRLNMRLGRSQKQSGYSGEERSLLPLPGDKPQIACAIA